VFSRNIWHPNGNISFLKCHKFSIYLSLSNSLTKHSLVVPLVVSQNFQRRHHFERRIVCTMRLVQPTQVWDTRYYREQPTFPNFSGIDGGTFIQSATLVITGSPWPWRICLGRLSRLFMRTFNIKLPFAYEHNRSDYEERY